MWDIVPDEQRGPRPKSARPRGVAPGSSPARSVSQDGLVARTRDAPLSGGLPGAITVGQ